MRTLPEIPSPEPVAEAAILVVIREGSHGPETLLIERAERAGDRASGQVSFPGGHREPTDPGLRSVALRETSEEVGLTSIDLSEEPRYFHTYPAPVFGIHVAAFLAPFGERGREPHPVDLTEVAEVFWFPFGQALHTERRLRRTHLGEREVDAAVWGTHVVWGFTRGVIGDIIRRLAPSSGLEG
ncbi:MAG: CoA pyrophosphatase [Thermoplasmata archaeon]|nr:CoA pyrophosphatase [Thermoplasmata archaeon]